MMQHVHIDFEPADFAELPAGPQVVPSYAQQVWASGPGAYWRLGEASPGPLPDQAGGHDLTAVGAVQRGAGGAIAFSADAAIDLAGGYLAAADAPGLRRGLGQTLGVCAWIAPTTAAGGKPRYLIGKGRTAPASSDQNWAVRLSPTGDGAAAVVSLLYRSADDQSWNWWNGHTPIVANTGYHFVALCFTFGQPASMRVWIDGAPGSGAWVDDGGLAAPIQNASPLWIGSTLGNTDPGFRFAGCMDELAVFDQPLSDDLIASLYRKGAGR